MFGGLWHDAVEKNVFKKLIYVVYNKALTGVVCPAYILNCVHQATENLEVDNECVICKIYQYFHTYTAQTEQLKQHCDFVDTE